MTQPTALSERTVEVSNGRLKIHVKVGGDGPPVVYFHPSAGLLWDPFLTRLAEHYTIYAPEFPGTSTGDPYAIHKVDDMWDVVLAYEETLRSLDLGRPAAIGQSFGGMLTAEIAASYPATFSKLVLLDPVGLWRDDAPVANWIAVAPDKLPDLLFLDPQSPAAQAMLALPEDPDARISAQAALVWALGCTGKMAWPIPDRGLKKRLHRITAPTLIVWGEDDKLAPVVYAEEFRQRIADSRVELISKAGHIPQVEQMDTTYELVTRFLQELGQRTRAGASEQKGKCSGSHEALSGMTSRLRTGITVVHGTLDPASDPEGYARVQGRGPCVITIGKFDGVHRAHQLLLDRTLAEARQRGLQAGVVTFDVHPREALHAADFGYLTTSEERVELFAEAGMDFVLLLRATRELFSTEAEGFWASLISSLDFRAVVVGSNFRFGRGAAGDVTTLAKAGRAVRVHAIILDLLADLGDTISSSRIRMELEAGRVDRAADLLGRPISVAGLLEVEDGGQWMVKVPPRMALPAPGAYSGRVEFTGSNGPIGQPAVVIVRASGNGTAQLHVMPHSGLIPSELHGQPVRVIFGHRQPSMPSAEHRS